MILQCHCDQWQSLLNHQRAAISNWVCVDKLHCRPAKLINISKSRFLKAGGVLFEYRGLSKVDVFDNGAVRNLLQCCS
jgi:hypothetical protein